MVRWLFLRGIPKGMKRKDVRNPKNNSLRLKEGQQWSDQIKESLGNLRRSLLYFSPYKNIHILECKMKCNQLLPTTPRQVEAVDVSGDDFPDSKCAFIMAQACGAGVRERELGIFYYRTSNAEISYSEQVDSLVV